MMLMNEKFNNKMNKFKNNSNYQMIKICKFNNKMNKL